jgi:hypothetical protein
LEALENFYTLEIEAGNDRDDLKPDGRAYNAVMGIWSKSKAEKKAVETKARLFDKLQQALYDNTLECSDYASNLRSYNNVISAFTKGDKDECKEALNVMVGTFNSMRGADASVKANHVTFGMFLKACSNLMPDNSKRNSVIEKLFRTACKDGQVSDFVINQLFEVTSTSFVEELLGSSVEDGIQIPAEWSRNVGLYVRQ